MHLVVLDRFDVGPEDEGRWGDWYRGARLPRWKGLGGFDAARLYRRMEDCGGPSHLALVTFAEEPGAAAGLQRLVREEGEGLEAPDFIGAASMSAYRPFWERTAAGNQGGTAPTGPIQIVTLNIFGEKAREINAWYEDRHIPELLEHPGLQWARRYRRLAGGPRFLTLYHFADAAAVRAYVAGPIIRSAQADRRRYNPWMTIVEHTDYVPLERL